jgi:hypothetical protein
VSPFLSPCGTQDHVNIDGKIFANPLFRVNFLLLAQFINAQSLQGKSSRFSPHAQKVSLGHQVQDEDVVSSRPLFIMHVLFNPSQQSSRSESLGLRIVK